MNSCQYIRSITITIVPPLDLSLLDFISALRETQLRHQHQTESAHPKRHSPSRSPAYEQSRFTTNNAAEIDEPNHYHPIDDAHVETKRVGACRRVAAPPAPAVLSEAETDGPATRLGMKPRRGGHAAGLFVERLLCHREKIQSSPREASLG